MTPALRARQLADIRAIAEFITGWHPGYEDAISWGCGGEDGESEDNAVFQAAKRVLASLDAPPAVTNADTSSWGLNRPAVAPREEQP